MSPQSAAPGLRRGCSPTLGPGSSSVGSPPRLPHGDGQVQAELGAEILAVGERRGDMSLSAPWDSPFSGLSSLLFRTNQKNSAIFAKDHYENYSGT